MTYERNLRIGVDSYTNDELVLSVYGNSSFSGIISATSFNGNFNGSIDISNYSNTSGISTSTVGGIVDVSDAIISGVSTLGFFTDEHLVSQSASLAPNTTYYTLHKNITVGSGATLSIGAGSTIILDRFNNLDDVKVNSLVSVNNIGIKTTNPTSALYVVGDAYLTGILTAFDINSASDRFLKENIQTIENALDIVCQIRGVTFDWKSTKRPSAGVISQEVEEIFPQLVSKTDPKTVNYNGLIGVLIEAIKELKQEVEELKRNKN